MRLALRELRRRPGRCVTATAVLAVLAVLLMFLGGLLDGLLVVDEQGDRQRRRRRGDAEDLARSSVLGDADVLDGQ